MKIKFTNTISLMYFHFWAGNNIEPNTNLFIEHLDGLLMHCSYYFKSFDFTKLAWI